MLGFVAGLLLIVSLLMIVVATVAGLPADVLKAKS